MVALAYRMRWWARARRRSTLLLLVAVAAGVALALALVAGAARTLSAPDRYESWRGDAFDVSIQQSSGRARATELEGLASVDSIAAATFVFGGVVSSTGEPVDGLVFAGSYLPLGAAIIEGRGPRADGEALASRSLLDATGLRVGDRVDIVTLTQEQADAQGFDAPEPAGPELHVSIVGVLQGPADLEGDFPVTVVPASMIDGTDIGVASTVMSAALHDGATEGDLRKELDEQVGGGDFSVQPAQWVSAEVRRAVIAQGVGLAVVAAVAAATVLVVLGQALSRQLRLSDAEIVALRAIGSSSGDGVVEAVARATAVVVPAGALALAGAYVASSSFPRGFVAVVEPHPGRVFDVVALLGGLAALGGGLLTWVAVTSRARRARATAAVPLGERLAARVSRPTIRAALRFALTTPGRGQRIGATLAGLVVVVAGVFASCTFATNLGDLLRSPAQWGESFDVSVGAGATAISQDVIARLAASDDVAAVATFGTTTVSSGSTNLSVVGMASVRGDMSPRVVAGRLPVAADEVALGPRIASRLGVDVGDDLAVHGAAGRRTLRIVGLAMAPPVNGADVIGEIGLVAAPTLHSLDPDAGTSAVGIDLVAGDREARLARLGRITGGGVGPSDPPSSILNLQRVRSLPWLVAEIVGVLAALSFGHLLVTTVRGQRVEHAILRTLGATSGWVGRVVILQATVLSASVTLVSVTVGVATGSVVHRAVSRAAGVPPVVSTPFGLLASLAGSTLLLAALVATVPARRSRRLRPAALLRVD